jgi:hypothetical protein
MSSPRAIAVGALFVLVAGTAACGASSVAPKIQLRDALGAIGEAGTASFTLSLPSSTDDVRAFITATGEDTASFEDSMLEDLLGIEVFAAYDSGTSDATADDAGQFQVSIDGKDYAELRGVDEAAYLRVDVPGLTERYPAMADDVEAFRAQLDTMDLGSLEAAVGAALAGDWVSVDASEGSWLAEQQKSMEDAAAPDTEALRKRLFDLAGKALKASVTVRSAGEDDTGQKLIATANTRDMYQAVEDDLPELAAEFAPAGEEQLPPASEVPSIDVSASFWIEDGDLRRVELDLAQFLDEPTGHFVIRVDTAEVKSIKAPEGAVEVDLEQLMALSASQTEAAGAEYGAAFGSVEEAAAAVGEDFQAFASYDGSAPSVAQLPDIASYWTGMTPALELLAVGDLVQVTYDGEVACLTLGPDAETAGSVATGPC